MSGLHQGRTAGVDGQARPGPPSRRARNLVLVLLGLLAVAFWTGDLLLPVLIPDHGAVLLLLGDRLRNYALVSPHVDALEYYGIGLLRFTAPYPLLYLLGRWYGDTAVDWVERRAPIGGSAIRSTQTWFSRGGPVLAGLVPSKVVGVLAGASGMSMRTFVVARLIGGLVVLTAIRQLSFAFSDPLVAIGRWIADHPAIVVAATCALLALTLWKQWRSTRTDPSATGSEPHEPASGQRT